MEQSPISRPPGNQLLERIHHGMRVVDSNGKDLGRVQDVYLGDTTQAGDETGTGAATPGAYGQTGESGGTSPVDRQEPIAIKGMAGSFDRVPDVVRRRLERVGFVRISGGLLGRDRYADPDQVEKVVGDTVQLSVAEDTLVQP